MPPKKGKPADPPGGTGTSLTVCIEGNLGSGKSTFLKYFKEKSDVFCVLEEPISKWRDVGGHNLMDLMYKDPRKWGPCFQSYAQLTMLELHARRVVQPFKMMERSFYSAKYCFVKNLKREGLLEDAEYAVLTEWFNFVKDTIPLKVDMIVYLRTDPEVAYQRTLGRGRPEEINTVKLEYLERVHRVHEEWLVEGKEYLPCPVVTIDANNPLKEMVKQYSLCEEKMQNCYKSGGIPAYSG